MTRFSPNLVTAVGAILCGMALYLPQPAFGQSPGTQILGARFHLSQDGTLYTRPDATKEWSPRTAGLPRHAVYPFDELRPVRLTSAASAPGFHRRLIATSGTDVYVWDDAAWTHRTNRSAFGTYAYLTASAVSPQDPGDMLVGTSFHGIYRSTDGGTSWQDLSDAFSNLSRGAHYLDDFSSLAYSAGGETAYAAVRLGSELYALDLVTEERRKLPIPQENRILQLSLTPDGKIEARTASGVYRLTRRETADGSAAVRWRRIAGDDTASHTGGVAASDAATTEGAADSAAAAAAAGRMETAAKRYGMYLPFLQARGDALEEHIAFAKENGVNAFVIDMKDDRGRVTYDTELQMPYDVGAVREFIDLEVLSRRLEEAGIYLIGRLVVFKDEQLYQYQNHRLAVRDTRSAEPWGMRYEETNQETGETEVIQREHWVDPFSDEVWDYNIAIAEELEQRGVDEIQFDYIRFPSDGPVRHMTFPHRREHMRRIDALESFLAKARDTVSIPLGTDVFGFNGWYEMDYLAQNIAMIARHVDVISPMYYPSHFDSRFLGDRDFYQRAREIYRMGSRRARVIVDDQALIRPYVQAFLIGRELNLEEPEYYRYLTEQIEGSLSAGTGGFLLWNFSGRYYMVVDSLQQYTRIANAGDAEDSQHLD
jgi:hypothetical protein